MLIDCWHITVAVELILSTRFVWKFFREELEKRLATLQNVLLPSDLDEGDIALW